MNPSSTKTQKMWTSKQSILNVFELKLKNSSISASELFEELKSLLKRFPPQFYLNFSSLMQLLTYYQQPFNPVIKSLSTPNIKEFLKVTNLEEFKHFLMPLLDFFQRNDENETNLLNFLKLLTKFRFQNFIGFEKSMISLLEFLHFHIKDLKINKENLNNNQIYLLKLIMNVFMNIASKIPEIKEIDVKNISKNFYEKIHQIFFKIPIDIRLQHEHFLKFFISLFRIFNYFLEKIDDLAKDPKLLETIFVNLYKYSFIGTFYQKAIFGDLKENSSYIFIENNNEISSSSEFSDFEGFFIKSDKLEELYGKLRNYACLCLQTVIKIYPKIVISHWNKLFKTNAFSKDFIDFLRNIKELSMILKKTGSERKNYQGNYAEPSIFFLLIYEKSAKVRINLLNLVLLIVDNLPIKQWLAGFSAEKIINNKSAKKEGFLPISHQIYNSIKNLNWTMLFAMFLEDDVQVLCHILKIFSGIIANACFEKLPEDILNIIFCNYLFPLFQRKPINDLFNNNNNESIIKENEKINKINVNIMIEEKKTNKNEDISDKVIEFPEKLSEKFLETITIQANSLACISVLLGLSTKLQRIEEIYLKSPTNPSSNLLPHVIILLSSLFQHKEIKETEPVILIMECLNFLAKIQKNHHFVSFPYLNLIIQSFSYLEKNSSILKEIHLRETIGFYKVLEELIKANNPYLRTEEDEEENTEIDINNITMKNNLFVEFPENFLIFLKKKLFDGLSNESIEINISSLNILSNLKPSIWILYENDAKGILVLLENSIQKNISIKTAIFKVLGGFSELSIFIKSQSFSTKIIDLLIKSGSSVKNFNARIKNSWALANWMSKLSDFAENIEKFKPIYEYILSLSEDPKEKISSNGLRSLGYFLKNLPIKQFSIFLTIIPLEKLSKELKFMYMKTLSQENHKVLWNCCVSLKNLLISDKKALVFQVFDLDLYEKLLSLLKYKGNFKSQIHAIKTLLSINSEEIIKKTYKNTILTIIDSLDLVDQEGYNLSFIEYRSIDLLKILLIEFLFQRIHEKYDEDYIIELFFNNGIENNTQIFKYVNKFVHLIQEIYRKNKGNYQFNENEEEEKLKKTMGLPKNQEEIDELPVKGEEAVRLLIMKELASKGLKELLDKLKILKSACGRICQIIDSHEKIAIGFIFYDTMKEYSEIDLNKEEIELKIIKKGIE